MKETGEDKPLYVTRNDLFIISSLNICKCHQARWVFAPAVEYGSIWFSITIFASSRMFTCEAWSDSWQKVVQKLWAALLQPRNSLHKTTSSLSWLNVHLKDPCLWEVFHLKKILIEFSQQNVTIVYSQIISSILEVIIIVIFSLSLL